MLKRIQTYPNLSNVVDDVFAILDDSTNSDVFDSFAVSDVSDVFNTSNDVFAVSDNSNVPDVFDVFRCIRCI